MMEQGEPPIIGLSEDTLTDIPRTGRRKMDQDPLTFPLAVSKAAIWLLGTMLAVTGLLLTWLCVGQMGLREQNAVLLERSATALEQNKIIHAEVESLRQADTALNVKVAELQLKQAEHGWKRGD